MSAIEEIAAERRRQVEAEGWSEKHDDSHVDGSLAMAAALYASPRDDLKVVSIGESTVVFKDPWPWIIQAPIGFVDGPAWDKRKKHDRRRRLIIAGALIAAEIERIDRLDARIEKHLAPAAA